MTEQSTPAFILIHALSSQIGNSMELTKPFLPNSLVHAGCVSRGVFHWRKLGSWLISRGVIHVTRWHSVSPQSLHRPHARSIRRDSCPQATQRRSLSTGALEFIPRASAVGAEDSKSHQPTRFRLFVFRLGIVFSSRVCTSLHRSYTWEFRCYIYS